MTTLLLCLQIFFARILDVSISTVRTVYVLKGKTSIVATLAFLEITIWFLVAREAINVENINIWIVLSYSGGYTTGTIVGTFISKKFIKGNLGLEVISTKIKEENGKVDGIVHAIAHANTEDLHNDFIFTSKEGFAHANDVSAYSFVLTARMAKDLDMLKENASLVTLTYHGSTKVLQGYNVMGVAKAALESSVRYLAENLGKEGIRVNAVSAGPIKTLSAKGIKDFNSVLTVVEERAPLHRNVTIEQVGGVSTFLLSSMADAITGQIIYADSGFSIMGI